jgi:hypothetical protein
MLRDLTHHAALFYPRSLIKSTSMTKVSTAQKLAVVTRVAGRQIRQSRSLAALARAGRVAASHWFHALGQLWLEVTGFVFLVLAGIGGLAFFREYSRFNAGHSRPGRVILAAGFTLLFTWFGVTSFWRVRKRE